MTTLHSVFTILPNHPLVLREGVRHAMLIIKLMVVNETCVSRGIGSVSMVTWPVQNDHRLKSLNVLSLSLLCWRGFDANMQIKTEQCRPGVLLTEGGGWAGQNVSDMCDKCLYQRLY